MSHLVDRLGDLWNIALDLLVFYHECCTYCMPYDEGEVVWLSEKYDIVEELQSIIEQVCEVNSIKLVTPLTYEAVAKALDISPATCANCGVALNSEIEIGGDWLRTRGRDTREATHLLTRAFWPYLTHYTSTTGLRSGYSVLNKILNDGVIRGSSKYILGSQSVMAFTECSPLEILELTKDYSDTPDLSDEKYAWKRSRHGIAIKRDALVKLGAVPVIHGGEDVRQVLTDALLFRYVRWNRDQSYSDWTFEREFRIEGDLNLQSLDPQDVIVIVENRREQFQMLAQPKVTPFPVMPFDYMFSTDSPLPRVSKRQSLQW